MLLRPDPTKDREVLKRCLGPGGLCACGEPAVLRYVGGGPNWGFDWPRCAACPGTRRTQGKAIRAIPMMPHHRAVLHMLGDEDSFIAAVRLGYRPPSYDEHGVEIDGEVTIDLSMWEDVAAWP